MLTIKSIPAFNDNYIWLIQNNSNGCAVVDPGDATPVINYLQENGLELEAILITHHHNDHTGGISALSRHYPNVIVAGPKESITPGVTLELSEGDQISLFDTTFQIMELPGHTNDHIGYFGDEKLFCGDVLFSAGCGRIFEGSAEQMYHSLMKLANLPDETQVYCAHEYTASNIIFALAVEPDNQDLLAYRDKTQQLRSQGQSTLPSTLEQEKRINPFLRLNEESVICSVSNRTTGTTPCEIFTALRQWKNEF
ncbi:hydroxyacylglutathione hydrolase [Vibrio sp. JC009]|uniref:hydroxyacylglutathione hydrolase n=1 Tax=Vibrio sp. JC009 TaxID=2912314 RepID=UPI0023AF408A|nr:hydroxyacylglutathione hydrolase [Vibrio sp. JC009]WED21161.1 hydroxyacylglutathione hydrolase [Vibrio sp. JC009]